MRTRTITVREGEYLGPVDWSYDFWSHDWDNGGCVNPVCVEDGIRALVRLVKQPETKFNRCNDGISQEILCVGMYDGWPYWRPVPSVCVMTPFGAEWHSFAGLLVKERTRHNLCHVARSER